MKGFVFQQKKASILYLKWINFDIELKILGGAHFFNSLMEILCPKFRAIKSEPPP